MLPTFNTYMALKPFPIYAKLIRVHAEDKPVYMCLTEPLNTLS